MAHPALFDESHSLIPPAWRRWLGARLQGPPRGRRSRERQVCGIALGRIGDFILLLPSFRLLVRKFGADQCVLVVPESVVPLARLELPGVELITLPPEAGGLLRQILPVWWRHRRKFADYRFARRVVFMHLRPLYHEIATTWMEAAADFRLSPETYPHGPPGEIQAHRLVTSAALGRNVDLPEALPHFEHFTARNDGRLLIYPLSQDPLRSLPRERVVAILRLWRVRNRALIVLGGHPRDSAILEGYAVAMRDAGVGQVTVETPDGVVALIDHVAAAGAVFCADSATGHIGGAFDKPTVTLMGPAWYGIGQPWQRSERQRVFLFAEADDATVAAALPALIQSEK